MLFEQIVNGKTFLKEGSKQGWYFVKDTDELIIVDENYENRTHYEVIRSRKGSSLRVDSFPEWMNYRMLEENMIKGHRFKLTGVQSEKDYGTFIEVKLK